MSERERGLIPTNAAAPKHQQIIIITPFTKCRSPTTNPNNTTTGTGSPSIQPQRPWTQPYQTLPRSKGGGMVLARETNTCLCKGGKSDQGPNTRCPASRTLVTHFRRCQRWTRTSGRAGSRGTFSGSRGSANRVPPAGLPLLPGQWSGDLNSKSSILCLPVWTVAD